jgi:hypothetical protein
MAIPAILRLRSKPPAPSEPGDYRRWRARAVARRASIFAPALRHPYQLNFFIIYGRRRIALKQWQGCAGAAHFAEKKRAPPQGGKGGAPRAAMLLPEFCHELSGVNFARNSVIGE